MSLLLPTLPGLPLLSHKRPPLSPYVTRTLPEPADTMTPGLGTAQGQHSPPGSPALLSVPGEGSDPQPLQPWEAGLASMQTAGQSPTPSAPGDAS